MEALETIAQRRSIRKFLHQEPSIEEVKIILTAANQAPSAKIGSPGDLW